MLFFVVSFFFWKFGCFLMGFLLFFFFFSGDSWPFWALLVYFFRLPLFWTNFCCLLRTPLLKVDLLQLRLGSPGAWGVGRFVSVNLVLVVGVVFVSYDLFSLFVLES